MVCFSQRRALGTTAPTQQRLRKDGMDGMGLAKVWRLCTFDQTANVCNLSFHSKSIWQGINQSSNYQCPIPWCYTWCFTGLSRFTRCLSTRYPPVQPVWVIVSPSDPHDQASRWDVVSTATSMRTKVDQFSDVLLWRLLKMKHQNLNLIEQSRQPESVTQRSQDFDVKWLHLHESCFHDVSCGIMCHITMLSILGFWVSLHWQDKRRHDSKTEIEGSELRQVAATWFSGKKGTPEEVQNIFYDLKSMTNL